jgi:hypothetical protein
MKNIVVIISSVFVVFFAQSAAAETFIVELPGLVGELPESPNGLTAAFDFGVGFLSIDEVRIQASGTFTPGEIINVGGGPISDLPPNLGFYMKANPGWASSSIIPYTSPFYDLEDPMGLLLGANWDFLLDGNDVITASLSYGGTGDTVILSPPTGQLSEVYLIIEGTQIPEPATLSVLLLGSFIFAGGKTQARKPKQP